MLRQIASSVINEIKQDFVQIRTNPFSILFSPEKFEPPFTNSLDIWFNITNGDLNLVPLGSDSAWLSVGKLAAALVFAGCDVCYSVVRLFAAGSIVALLLLMFFFVTIWIFVTVSIRFKHLLKISQYLDWERIC